MNEYLLRGRITKLFSTLLIIFIQILSCGVFSQSVFDKKDSVKVFFQDDVFDYPWTGGYNFCQFSSIDLNGDSIKDLFVFDKTGNRISTFLNTGKNNEVSYRYAPEYVSSFPMLTSWVLLYDYDNDGKEDIFSSTSGGVKVHRNISNGRELKFQLQSSLLMSNYNSLLNLYVSPADLPAIVDVDSDGDVDVLTFSILGSTLEWHKNLSQELYGHSDSLIFQLETSCWGKFEENNLSNEITLNVSCQGRDNEQGGSRHSGSTLLALDIDGDRDKDLLVGDVSSKQLTLLINGGDLKNALIVSQDRSFPSNTKAVEIINFPAAFLLDINNDNKQDLIVSPNAPNVSENFQSVHLYKNVGSTNVPVFVFEKNNFLQQETVELGEGAYPVLFDIDRDGLKDLMTGNYGYFNSSTGTYVSKVAFFKNVGNKDTPEYSLINSDLAELSKSNKLNLMPAFGDLDGDGNADMLVGDQDGLIHCYSGIKDSLTNYIKTSGTSYFNIDVGQAGSPFIFDVNADGKLDLVIGEKNGTLNYFPNNGSMTSPLFDTMIEFWGGVDVRLKGYTVGYSVPYLYFENGSLKLLVGSESGKIYLYDNLENNLTGNFELVNDFFAGINEGIRTAPSGSDLNGDGLMDLIIGNYSGGLSFYYGTDKVSIKNNAYSLPNFKIYPNPVKEKLIINWAEDLNCETGFTIFSLLGEALIERKLITNNSSITLTGIPSGVYLVELVNKYGRTVRKLIKE